MVVKHLELYAGRDCEVNETGGNGMSLFLDQRLEPNTNVHVIVEQSKRIDYHGVVRWRMGVDIDPNGCLETIALVGPRKNNKIETAGTVHRSLQQPFPGCKCDYVVGIELLPVETSEEVDLCQ